MVSNEGSTSSGAVAYKLQVAQTSTCGSGTYTDVPAKGAAGSAHWQVYPTSYLTDGAATTNVANGLTDENSTFVPGQVKDTGGTTGTITLTGSQFTEIEFAVKATGNAAGGANYCFRLVKADGSPLDTYTAYGQVQMAPCNFGYSRTLTVQSGKVGCTLTNFPMLVSFTNANLKSTGNGGHVASSSGYDIIFRAADTTTCGGAAPCTLDHEIEKYDPATGQLVAWVRVPSVSVGTVITMQYGNACVAGSTANPTGVWDSSYKGVWHLSNNSFADSTLNSNSGTNTGTSDATGEMANARSFNGSSNYISVADNDSLNITSQLTVEAWVKLTNPSNDQKIVGKTNNSVCNRGYILGVRNGDLRPEFWNSSGAYYTFDAGTINSSQWTHLVVTWTTGGNMVGYINGATPTGGSISAGPTNIGTYTNPLYMGTAPYNHTQYFANGTIDEVRISSTARTGCWITAEYNNQSNPGTPSASGFYAVGSEQGAGVTAVTLLEFTAVGDGSDVKVGWQTTLESQNMGFYLYRAESREGPYEKLTPQLIAGGFDSPGGSYGFTDKGLVRGRLYYYLLEDVDVHGQVTRHGPICVDWDGDGLPDDWEMAYGLNPNVNDADLDSDGDGVPNWLEYQRGTDPFNPDSDGDGVSDGGEKKSPGYAGGPSIAGADASVQVIASDAQGMTLELADAGL